MTASGTIATRHASDPSAFGRALLTFVSVAAVSSCGLDRLGQPPGSALTTAFTVTGDSVVTLGAGLPLAIAPEPGRNLAGTRLVWSTSNTAIARVDSAGVVTGVSVGTVQITARLTAPQLDTGLTQVASVRVRYKGVQIDRVDTIPSLGDTRTPILHGTSATGAAQPQRITPELLVVRDTTVLRVASGSAVQSISNGSSWVIATFDGATDSTLVVVRQVAAKLGFATQPQIAVVAASMAPVQVSALDALGSVVTSATNAITMSLTSGTGTPNATLGGPKTQAAVNGVATFAALTVSAIGTGYTLTASASGLTSAFSFAFAVTAPSVPVRLGFVRQPTTTTAGVPFAGGVQVAIQDGSGATVTSSSAVVQLAFSTNTTGAVLIGPVTATAVNGIATFSALRVGRAGAGYTLVASAPAGGLNSATSNAFDILTGPAAALAFVVGPSATAAGATISPAVQVVVLDSMGNAVSAASIPVTLALATGTAGASLTGTTTVPSLAGTASFASLKIDKAGTYTLSATGPGVPSATSGTFLVSAGVATRVGFVTQPSSAAVNATISPAVQVAIQDAGGNTITSASNTISLSIANGTGTNGAALGGTRSVTAVNGVASFGTLTIDKVGAGYTLAAATSGGLTSATSSAFVITAAAPSVTSINPSSPARSSSAQSIEVDGSGFQAGMTVTLTSPGGSASTVTATSVQSQNGNASVVLGTAGTWSLRVTNPDGQSSGVFTFTVR